MSFEGLKMRRRCAASSGVEIDVGSARRLRPERLQPHPRTFALTLTTSPHPYDRGIHAQHFKHHIFGSIAHSRSRVVGMAVARAFMNLSSKCASSISMKRP